LIFYDLLIREVRQATRAQNNLGGTYQVLAQHGVAPKQNLQHSVKAFTEAAHRFKEQQNWANHAMAQKNLEMTYRGLARHGIEPEKNLRLAGQAFKEANAHGQN